MHKVLDISLRLHNSELPTGHEAFAVLDEKTDDIMQLCFLRRIIF